MADAFRGLTLRLGADARPLQSAIGSVTQAAAQAQRQFNKMQKALRFDNTNLRAMNSALALSEDRAQLMARGMRTVKTAMDQAAAEGVKFRTAMGGADGKIGDIANSVRNVYAQSQKLRSEGVHVNAELQHIYDSVKNVRSGMLQGKGAAKDMLGPFLSLKDATKSADEYVKKLQRDMMAGGAKAEGAFREISNLLKSMGTRELNNLADKFGLSGAEDKAKALYDTFAKLHARSGDLSHDLKEMYKVEGFKAMRTEAIAFESALREAVSETVRLKAETAALGSAKGLDKAIGRMKGLDSAIDAASSEARAMASAFKAVPSSVELAGAKMRASRNEMAALEAKARELRSAIKSIEAENPLARTMAQSKNVHVEFERAKAAAIDAGTAFEKARSKVEALESELREANSVSFIGPTRKVEELNAELAEERSRLNAVESEARAADHALEEMATVKHLSSMRSDLAGVVTQMSDLGRKASLLSKMGNFGKGLREFGFGMYASLTPALMMAGRYAVQAATDTDAAYRDMRKTVNGTDEEFRALYDDAVKFSTTHITTAEQMLEIESIGGQLGIAVENLQEFAHTVSNLDIATNMDAEDIATDLGKMASVMGISTEQYSNFGDALVRLGNNMPAMESDIMTVTTRYMGMGKVVGMSADQMLAWSTAATATGQKSEAAGSAMQRFISNMETAVASGKGLEDWAKVAGMSAGDFAQKFGEDANGAMLSFVKGLGEIQRSGGSVNQTLKELGINNVRDKQLLEGLAMQMANASDGASILEKSLQMSSEAWNGQASILDNGKIEAAGDAMREAEKKSEGFSGSMGKMANQAKSLALTFADATAPMIDDLGRAFGNLADDVRGMPDGFKTAVVGIGAALAGLGPATVGLGTFLQSGEKVAGLFKKLPSGISTVGAKITEFASRSTKATSAIGKLRGAFAGFSAAGVAGLFVAGAAAVGILAKNIADAVAKTDLMNAANGRLKDSVSGLISGLKTAERGALDYGNSIQINAKSLGDLKQAESDMASAISERSQASSDQIARLNAAKDVLMEYTGTTLTSAEAQGRFRAAIDTVNEICGTHYKVIDAGKGVYADEQGAIQNSISAIEKLIETRKKAIREEALSATYKDLYEGQAEAARTWFAEQKKYDDMVAQASQRGMSTETTGEQLENQRKIVAEAEETYRSFEDEIKAVEGELGRLSTETDGAAKSIGSMTKDIGFLQAVFANDEATFSRFADEMDKVGISSEQLKSISENEWQQIISAWGQGDQTLSQILEGMGYDILTLAEQYQDRMRDVESASGLWERALENTGMKADELAKALSDAGISAEQFAGLSADSFTALYAAAGGSLQGVKSEIDLLRAAGIDPINVTVDDGQLKTTQGVLIEMEGDIARIDGRTFRVNAEGNWEEVREDIDETQAAADEGATMQVDAESEGLAETEEGIDQIQQAASEGAEMQVTVNDEQVRSKLAEILSEDGMEINASINFSYSGLDEALGGWESLKAAVSEGASGNVEVTDNANEAKSHMDTLSEAVEGLPDKTVYVTVGGGALSTINSIRSALAALDGKRATTYVNTVRSETRQAAGGINPTPMYRVPMFAAGGALDGIVTRAMMTNQGLVGEAGSEAMLRMGRSTAVVPLSNRRYVRPFARAVAAEMGGRSQSQRTYNVTLNYTGREDPTAIAREMRLQFQRLDMMEA